MGPYYYSTDEFIEGLELPTGVQFGVMINGKDFLDGDTTDIDGIKNLFCSADKSPISLVRIAINFNAASKVEKISKQLKDLGYQVGVNLMQSNNKEDDQYIKIADKIRTWNSTDILYFADSLGNMNPNDVIKICNSLKKGWDKSLGIHTHNNKSLALINSITAIENEVTWCDGTIGGMGRGAGNVTTESLIMELSLLGKHEGDATALNPAVEDFRNLKDIYNWGPNLYYHYSANNNIHPTFVQELLNDSRYDKNQIMGHFKVPSKK